MGQNGAQRSNRAKYEIGGGWVRMESRGLLET